MTLLLYALVTPSGAKPRLRGMRGEPLRVVSAAGVGALIGAVSSSPQPQARNLRAYHDVMLAVSRRFTALVPVRFGTAVADEEELSFILRTRAETFRRLLAAVRGRVQMTARFVDVSGGEEDSERPADRSSGTAYLRSRATLHVRLAESAACVQLRGRVERWIRGERLEWRNRVMTMYHLVPRGAAERYRRAIEDIALPDGRRVHVSGPFHPSPSPIRCGRRLPPQDPRQAPRSRFDAVAKGKPAPARRGSRRSAPQRRTRRTKIIATAGAITVSEVEELDALRREIERISTSPLRWNADPDDVQRSVAHLVLTLVEFIRKLLERQAIRRMEQGTLTQQQTEDVGRALMKLEETLRDIAEKFGIHPDELNLDLGPVGKLM